MSKCKHEIELDDPTAPQSFWRCQIIKRLPNPKSMFRTEICFGIHEVHYKRKRGTKTTFKIGWSEMPTSVAGVDNVEDMLHGLELIHEALTRPIIVVNHKDHVIGVEPCVSSSVLSSLHW